MHAPLLNYSLLHYYNAINDNPMLISSQLLTERNALRFIELFMFAVTNIDIFMFDLVAM